MAFRVHAGESLTQSLHRLATKELRHAREGMSGRPRPRKEGIHEARKSVKKARAILELIAEDEGAHLGRSEKRVRRVNRTLSGVRDADMLSETLEALRKRHPRIFSDQTLARLRRRVSMRSRNAGKEVRRAGGWKATGRALSMLTEDAKHWQPAHGGARALNHGIRASHRQGRTAMQRALKRQRAADFHAWRKAIQKLWYALRLIEQSDRRVGHDVKVLHRAATLLGDDHNLAVLRDELLSDPGTCGPIDIERLRIAVARDQCRLRARAVTAVRRFYARRSAAYARRVTRAWAAWRKRAQRD